MYYDYNGGFGKRKKSVYVIISVIYKYIYTHMKEYVITIKFMIENFNVTGLRLVEVNCDPYTCGHILL